MYTFRVLGGPGVGQTRLVTGWDPVTKTLTLEGPLDDHFLPGVVKGVSSTVAVEASFGAKAIVGNLFNWTE